MAAVTKCDQCQGIRNQLKECEIVAIYCKIT